jgi:hypothetical protein
MARIKKTKSKQKVGKQRRTRKRVTRRLRGGGLFSNTGDVWLDVGYPYLYDISPESEYSKELIRMHFNELLNVNNGKLKLKSVDTNTNKETVYGTLVNYDTTYYNLTFNKGGLLNQTTTIPKQTFKKIIEDKTQKLQYSLPINAKIKDFPTGWTKCDSADCFKKGRFYVILKSTVGDQIRRNDLEKDLGQLNDVTPPMTESVSFVFDTATINIDIGNNKNDGTINYNNMLKTYYQKLAFKD